MYNIPGQSISVVSDSISKNGIKNTATAFCLLLLGVACGASFFYIVKRKLDNNKHENAKDLSNTKCDNAIKQMEAKTEAAIKLDDHKTANMEKILHAKAELSKEKARKEETLGPKNEVSPMKSFDDILAMEDVKFEDRILLYSFLQKGDSLGICGPTNIGKSTFVFQLLLNLASGNCEYPISGNHYPIQPQNVLLFTTEQRDKEIKSNYIAVTDRLPNFKIESVETSPEEILAKVKMEMETADSKGLVIAIDNYTWLKNAYDIKKLKLLDRELSNLQRANQNKKPVTIIKVFHTNDKYRIYRPVELHHVQGGQNIANLTKNFIYITPCDKGHETRILKVAKDKVGGTRDTVSILKYAGSDPSQFVYVGEAVEAEVLPKRQGSHATNPTCADDRGKLPGKRGPKEKYNDKELREIQKELDSGSTWRKVFESRGIEYSKNKVKGIKAALKRHGIRAA